MNISEEQWEHIAEDLKRFGHEVKFCFQGMNVSYILKRQDVFTNVIMTYVDGEYNFRWGMAGDSYPQQRFLTKKWKYAYDASSRKRALKLSPKRLRQLGINPNEKIEYYSPYWTSIKALVRHLKSLEGLDLVLETV